MELLFIHNKIYNNRIYNNKIQMMILKCIVMVALVFTCLPHNTLSYSIGKFHSGSMLMERPRPPSSSLSRRRPTPPNYTPPNNKPPTLITTTMDEYPVRFGLDIGCGCGDSTKQLDLQCEMNIMKDMKDMNIMKDMIVQGIDLKSSCIKTASSRHPDLLFTQQDAMSTYFPDNKFHRIQIYLSLLEFQDVSRTLVHEMRRILHPDGILEVVDYSEEHSFLQNVYELPEPYRSRFYPQWENYDPFLYYKTFRQGGFSNVLQPPETYNKDQSMTHFLLGK